MKSIAYAISARVLAYPAFTVASIFTCCGRLAQQPDNPGSGYSGAAEIAQACCKVTPISMKLAMNGGSLARVATAKMAMAKTAMVLIMAILGGINHGGPRIS